MLDAMAIDLHWENHWLQSISFYFILIQLERLISVQYKFLPYFWCWHPFPIAYDACTMVWETKYGMDNGLGNQVWSMDLACHLWSCNSWIFFKGIITLLKSFCRPSCLFRQDHNSISSLVVWLSWFQYEDAWFNNHVDIYNAVKTIIFDFTQAANSWVKIIVSVC